MRAIAVGPGARRFAILGGTGTLGQELTRQLLKQAQTASISIISRDELKQKQMEALLGKNPRVQYRIADIRDREAMLDATNGVDCIFHCAALKHVEIAEANPLESIKTNLLATQNVIEAAEKNLVANVVFSSTDKAVDPVNVYGMCKGLSERLLMHRNTIQSVTNYKVYRWGNVLGSRGSIIHHFVDLISAGKPVPITDFRMSRFWITIEDAVAFMVSTYSKQDVENKPMIPHIAAANVTDIASAIAQELGKDRVEFLSIPMRPGEKIFESLRSMHDSDPCHSNTARQYTMDELRELVRPFVADYVKSIQEAI